MRSFPTYLTIKDILVDDVPDFWGIKGKMRLLRNKEVKDQRSREREERISMLCKRPR